MFFICHDECCVEAKNNIFLMLYEIYNWLKNTLSVIEKVSFTWSKPWGGDKCILPSFDPWILIITLKYWLDHLGPHKIVFSCMRNPKRYREVNSVQNVKVLYSRVWIINKNWQSCTWDCNLNIFFWIQYLCDWLWTKTPLTNYLICTNHLVYNPW